MSLTVAPHPLMSWKVERVAVDRSTTEEEHSCSLRRRCSRPFWRRRGSNSRSRSKGRSDSGCSRRRSSRKSGWHAP